MNKHIINQLFFSANAHTILPYLKAKINDLSCPKEFSLNSIVAMPMALELLLNPDIISLAKMNLAMPEFDENMKQLALNQLYKGWLQKKTEQELLESSSEFRKKIRAAETGKLDGNMENSQLETFEKAVTNFQEYQFFCQYDWRLTHWGTDRDICAIDALTFKTETSYIEFKTSGLPPIAALKNLADTFPSVRFTLLYRSLPDNPWIKMSIFPSLPFGY